MFAEKTEFENCDKRRTKGKYFKSPSLETICKSKMCLDICA